MLRKLWADAKTLIEDEFSIWQDEGATSILSAGLLIVCGLIVIFTSVAIWISWFG